MPAYHILTRIQPNYQPVGTHDISESFGQFTTAASKVEDSFAFFGLKQLERGSGVRIAVHKGRSVVILGCRSFVINLVTLVTVMSARVGIARARIVVGGWWCGLCHSVQSQEDSGV